MLTKTNIFYDCIGEGNPLVLISGLSADSLFWGLVTPILSKKFRVITNDNRGIGKSPLFTPACTTTLMANDIITILDELHIDKADIVGHSLGGCIAQQLAILHPERVKKLILCSTQAKITPIGKMSIMTTREMMSNNVSYELIIKNTLVRLYSNQFLSDPERVQILIKTILTKPFEESRATYFYQSDALFHHDTSKELDKIKMPTLIISGEVDYTIPLTSSYYLSKYIPSSTIITIPDMGHMLPIEDPELFSKYLIEFLH